MVWSRICCTVYPTMPLIFEPTHASFRGETRSLKNWATSRNTGYTKVVSSGDRCVEFQDTTKKYIYIYTHTYILTSVNFEFLFSLVSPRCIVSRTATREENLSPRRKFNTIHSFVLKLLRSFNNLFPRSYDGGTRFVETFPPFDVYAVQRIAVRSRRSRAILSNSG